MPLPADIDASSGESLPGTMLLNSDEFDTDGSDSESELDDDEPSLSAAIPLMPGVDASRDTLRDVSLKSPSSINLF